jgi:hypothetical protein
MENDNKNRDWVPKYIEYMIAGNFDAFVDLKNVHFPKSFFKYKKLNSETFDSLEKNYLWLSKISSLNDPFECSLQLNNDACLRVYYGDKRFSEGFKKNLNIEFSKEEIEQLTTSKKPYFTFIKICESKGLKVSLSAADQIKKQEKRWVEILTQITENIKVCCFSERKDSLLMWSHYANEHKGICIEYEFENESETRTFLQPILYSNKIHKINTFEDLTVLNQVASTLTKCKDWEYEEEWRLTILKQSVALPNTIQAPKPIAIYLGTRFHLNKEEEIEQLKKIAKEKGIPLYQMGKHSTEYKLVKIQ